MKIYQVGYLVDILLKNILRAVRFLSYVQFFIFLLNIQFIPNIGPNIRFHRIFVIYRIFGQIIVNKRLFP
jgi:hypothetical protein